MTSVERMYGLYQTVKYAVARDVPGYIVECGVWVDDSAMVAARTFDLVGDTSRNLQLYDTFEGMTPPTEQDVNYQGVHANGFLHPGDRVDGESNVWAYASLEMVRKNLDLTGLPRDRFHLVKGRVEDTIPDAISMLRLDTDWHESTAHELKHMFPVLSPGGALIIDDYGHWRGSCEATDEYFAVEGNILLNRLDCSGRIGIKA